MPDRQTGNRPLKQLLAIIVCAALFACGQERGDPVPSSAPIRIAVLPDQSREIVLARHSPLIAYLENSTSLEIELSIPSSYEDLLVQYDAGKVDLGWFGGLTYVKAEQLGHAVPLAFRDVDLRFTSCYIAQAADARTSIRDFEGEDFSFGPWLSTSGHLMPRYFLEGAGRYPEQFFASVRHSEGHDQTTQQVGDGTVGLGVANCMIVQAAIESGRLGEQGVKIIETTPPYSDYVWASSPAMDARTRDLLLDAFLALDATNPEHREILRLQGANTYYPAGHSNFTMVRTAAERAGLLDDDGTR